MNKLIALLNTACLIAGFIHTYEATENVDFLKEYYWRDYTGFIPPDAVIGGHDINRRPTYIGQAFFKENYLQVGTIFPGKDNLVASFEGKTISTKTYIKILCSTHLSNLSWIIVKGNNMKQTIDGKRPVVVGTENDGLLNVGRLQFSNRLISGKVTGYDIENVKLFFPFEEEERSVSDFELLVCETPATNGNVSVIDTKDLKTQS